MPTQQDQQCLRLRLSPFDLPEIVNMIHPYLQGDFPSILSCCLVSKAFNEAFRPLMWEEMIFSTDVFKNNPPTNVLQKNTRFVKSLVFEREANMEENIPALFSYFTYPRLKEIEIRSNLDHRSGWADLFALVSILIQRHEKTLYKVTLRNLTIHDTDTWFCHRVMQGLRALVLGLLRFSGLKANRLFWMMCTQPCLEDLSIRSVELVDGTEAALEQKQRYQESGERQFKLQKFILILSRLDPESYKQLVGIATRSPDLKSLTLFGNKYIDHNIQVHGFPPLIPYSAGNDPPRPIWQHLTAVKF